MFSEKLCDALAELGYKDVKVRGYEGEFSLTQGEDCGMLAGLKHEPDVGNPPVFINKRNKTDPDYNLGWEMDWEKLKDKKVKEIYSAEKYEKCFHAETYLKQKEALIALPQKSKVKKGEPSASSSSAASSLAAAAASAPSSNALGNSAADLFDKGKKITADSIALASSGILSSSAASMSNPPLLSGYQRARRQTPNLASTAAAASNATADKPINKDVSSAPRHGGHQSDDEG